MTARPASVLLTLAIAISPHTLAGQENGGLERKATEWLGYLQAEHFDSAAALVSPVARSSMGEEQLAMIWPRILEHFGELEKTAPLNRLVQGGYTVVQLLGTFANGTQTIGVVFDKDSLVAGFVVDPPGKSVPPATAALVTGQRRSPVRPTRDARLPPGRGR
jgi:hypothetical protein